MKDFQTPVPNDQMKQIMSSCIQQGALATYNKITQHLKLEGEQKSTASQSHTPSMYRYMQTAYMDIERKTALRHRVDCIVFSQRPHRSRLRLRPVTALECRERDPLASLALHVVQ